MSKKGGYQIINLQDMPLANGKSFSIAGIYAAIEGNYRKPILLSGITIDGVEQPDTFVSVAHTDDQYVLTIPGIGSVTVLSDNVVTFNPIETDGE